MLRDADRALTSSLAVALAIVVSTAACRSPSPPPLTEGSEGSAESAAPTPSEQQAPEAADLMGAPEPQVDSEEQLCRSNADCRIYQPGDWSPRVECCYEYPCDLDYVAVNEQTWAELRRWRDANPFDCAALLQNEGPCRHRRQRCGLSQQAPEAICAGGLCDVAYPTHWPRVEADSQSCTITADCLAFRPSSLSFDARCCGSDCIDDWTAINRATAIELDLWSNEWAGSCETWLSTNTCAAPRPCVLTPPAVGCRSGQCVIF